MPRTHPPYAPEYRRRIIELARAGRSIDQLAREFEPTANAIRKWVKQALLDDGLRSDEIAAIRRTEAGSAASRIGAEYRCAEFRDLTIFNDDASRRRVVEILRRSKPNLILTSSPIDYMCDHEATSSLVRD